MCKNFQPKKSCRRLYNLQILASTFSDKKSFFRDLFLFVTLPVFKILYHIQFRCDQFCQSSQKFSTFYKGWPYFPFVRIVYMSSHTYGPSLKSALRPPPSALAESANFRPFYVKRADFSPPPPATKKRRKLVKIRPRCPHLATKKRRKVVKIRLCGGWWVGGWFPPPPLFL